MAIYMLGHRVEYIGLAADGKPTVMANGDPLPYGSKFYELDTSCTYMWSGSTWYPFHATSS